jgi:hypothetical protein
MGVAVLGSVFSAAGSFATSADFVSGLRPALAVGAVVLAVGAVGAVAAMLIPGRKPTSDDHGTVDLRGLVTANSPIPAASGSGLRHSV